MTDGDDLSAQIAAWLRSRGSGPPSVLPHLTDVEETLGTWGGVLADDPELYFLGDEGVAVGTMVLADGPWCIAIGSTTGDDDALGEWIAERLQRGCRVTVIGRWAAVQDFVDEPDRRMLVINQVTHLDEHPGRPHPESSSE